MFGEIRDSGVLRFRGAGLRGILNVYDDGRKVGVRLMRENSEVRRLEERRTGMKEPQERKQ